MPASAETQQLTVTLPTDIVELIRASVSSGEYEDEGEVIEAAVCQSLLPPQSNAALEQWIATEGVRRYDALKADPSRGLTSEEFFASLDSEPKEFFKAG